jgi:8-amino-3,8-dideoxy-alpha-D-manno-octulosonate transaminase
MNRDKYQEVAMKDEIKKLAIHGGEPAVQEALPPMYPGGMLIDKEEEQAVLESLRAKRLFRYYGPNPGPSKAAQLEEQFAAFMGAGYGLAVTSGTAALICSLISLGVGPGDEVIVPAYTWIATAAAVVAVGAVPVIAEVDESLTLDPVDLELKITPFTRAVIPVHMRGGPCRMDRIMAVARKHDLKVIEDAAQADGASFQGRRLGNWGDVGAFSLQFNKIATSGEGGMLITSDQKVWERATMYHDVVGGHRNHVPEASILPGVNFRMPELLAAVALVQLGKLDGMLMAMRRNKQVLKDSLSGAAAQKGVRFRTIHDAAGDAAIALIFYLPEREQALRVAEALNAEGAPSFVMYSPDQVDYHIYQHWSPIMNQRTWTPEGGPWKNHPRKVTYEREMCPRTLDLLGRAIHLDVSPSLTNTNLEELCEALEKALRTI